MLALAAWPGSRGVVLDVRRHLATHHNYERRMHELAQSYGPDTLEAAFDEIITRTEARLRAHVRDGSGRAHDLVLLARALA